MIKKNLKTMIITSIIIVATMIPGVILWNQLPAQIATHFDANGVADGWSPKEFAVFGLPLILLAVHWLCAVFTGADPKNKNISEKMTMLVMWLCPVVSIVGCGSTYMYALDSKVNTTRIAFFFMGCLFLVIGNYMPKMKQSYTIGIKIPWALNSEENWNRTHRLAGYMYMLAGVVTIIAGFIQQFWLAIVALLIASLVPTVYSYLLYKKGI